MISRDVSHVTQVVAHTHKTEAGKVHSGSKEGPEGSVSVLGQSRGLARTSAPEVLKQQLADTPSSRTSN